MSIPLRSAVGLCFAFVCFSMSLWQRVGSGRAAGWPLWQNTRQKMLPGRSKWTHTQGTVSITKTGVSCLKTYWRGKKKYQDVEKWRKKRWGKSSVNLQISEEAQEGDPGTEDIHTVASGENWIGADGYALKELQPMESPHWSTSWSTARHSTPDPN